MLRETSILREPCGDGLPGPRVLPLPGLTLVVCSQVQPFLPLSRRPPYMVIHFSFSGYTPGGFLFIGHSSQRTRDARPSVSEGAERVRPAVLPGLGAGRRWPPCLASVPGSPLRATCFTLPQGRQPEFLRETVFTTCEAPRLLFSCQSSRWRRSHCRWRRSHCPHRFTHARIPAAGSPGGPGLSFRWLRPGAFSCRCTPYSGFNSHIK